jgi:prepilin-type N-terminal cleavage/methylation domain-containing protein
MNKQYKQLAQSKASGFTIIEVVLVLAIAGLIFLMVFIALPALQRGQRDAQRKQDLSRVSVQMTNYLSSSRGSIPTSDQQLQTFVQNYLRRESDKQNTSLAPKQAGDDYKDPDGDNYRLLFSQKPDQSQIGYYPKRLCSPDTNDGTTATDSAPRDYAFTIKLESQDVPFCIDNKS